MGQYHIVYNKTKKEFIHGHRIDNGLKLMEQVGWPKSTSSAVWLLLANSNGRGGGDARGGSEMVGRWAGDALVVQGDYAEEGDPSFIPEEELRTYTDISSQVKQMLDKEMDD